MAKNGISNWSRIRVAGMKTPLDDGDAFIKRDVDKHISHHILFCKCFFEKI